MLSEMSDPAEIRTNLILDVQCGAGSALRLRVMRRQHWGWVESRVYRSRFVKPPIGAHGAERQNF